MNINGVLKYFPRAFVIQKKLNGRYGFLVTVFYLSFSLLWLLFLRTISSFYLLLRWTIPVVFSKERKLPNSIYLSLSDSKYFSFIERSEILYPSAILSFPFRKEIGKSLDKEFEQLNLLHISSVWILVKAFFYSSLFSWSLVFSKERSLILYSYSSFNWFWCYFALSESKINNIWLSNHYDRWNVLVSNLKNTRVTMVQHGTLYFYNPSQDLTLFPDFSGKLKQVRAIYTLNEISKMYYGRFVDTANLCFGSIKSKLQIVDWRERGIGKFKILIVGHQGEIQFQSIVIERLFAHYPKKIDICYKYHPNQTNQCRTLEVWEYREKFSIPKTDLVISYGSSLDDEIEQLLDLKVCHYDFREKNVKQLIQDVESILGKQSKDLYV